MRRQKVSDARRRRLDILYQVGLEKCGERSTRNRSWRIEDYPVNVWNGVSVLSVENRKELVPISIVQKGPSTTLIREVTRPSGTGGSGSGRRTYTILTVRTPYPTCG